MGSIKILDTHTINKIAAGEVVERPSSVVKELVENSIDAKASSVTVEIKNGGIDLIRITDNGIGIPKDQVEIAFLRHATSKITVAEDLYEVMSLGFRGEALASIAAVSNIELLTKREDDDTGMRVEISGGKINTSEEVATPNGTTFIVRHLFFNVPARKAFLGSSGSEAAKISDYMYKLALAHPEVSFKYIQNGKTLFITSGDNELKHAVLNIYGKEYAKDTLPCYYKNEYITCTGLIGKPNLNRGNRNYEHFFINGRYIKSQILQSALEDAYKTLVMVGKFPFAVIHIKMDPSLVDVNVHPTKLQVRFKNPDSMYKAIYEGVKEGLQSDSLVPDINETANVKETFVKPDTKQETVDTFFAPRKDVENLGNGVNDILANNKDMYYKKDSADTIERLFGKRKNPEDTFESIDTKFSSTPDISDNISITEADRLQPNLPMELDNDNTIEPIGKTNMGYSEELNTTDNISTKMTGVYEQNTNEYHINSSTTEGILPVDYRIVGQVFKTYWIIQYHEKVFIIDQHAAHERVLYERFMREFREHRISRQVLLLPETINLTPSERLILESNAEVFENLGFGYELFGENAVVIRDVPYILNEPIPAKVFKDVIDKLEEEKLTNITDIKAERIIKMSCRSAIKAHDTISEKECHKLINELLSLDNPFTCPHGRPTLVSLTQSDIEKMFKRIQ